MKSNIFYRLPHWQTVWANDLIQVSTPADDRARNVDLAHETWSPDKLIKTCAKGPLNYRPLTLDSDWGGTPSPDDLAGKIIQARTLCGKGLIHDTSLGIGLDALGTTLQHLSLGAFEHHAETVTAVLLYGSKPTLEHLLEDSVARRFISDYYGLGWLSTYKDSPGRRAARIVGSLRALFDDLVICVKAAGERGRAEEARATLLQYALNVFATRLKRALDDALAVGHHVSMVPSELGGEGHPVLVLDLLWEFQIGPQFLGRFRKVGSSQWKAFDPVHEDFVEAEELYPPSWVEGDACSTTPPYVGVRTARAILESLHMRRLFGSRAADPNALRVMDHRGWKVWGQSFAEEALITEALMRGFVGQFFGKVNS